jgi:colanic acid biosynthesis glycosyl transferase WcaI
MHIQDYEVEAGFATGLLKEDSSIGRLAKKFEAWVLKRFDRISSISAPMLDKLRDKGVPDEKIFELRNWANLAKVIPIEGESPMKAELGIATPHVALYSGNLANKQGLEIIPETARRLAHRKDLSFVICGDGPFATRLKELSAGLENIRFFPLQPLDKFSATLGMASVHLLPQIAGAADLVLPSKLTNMLASGRPVVATAMQGTALAEEVEGCGIVTPPGDPDALAAAIETILDDEDQRHTSGVAARARAFERWDSTQIIVRFQEELQRIIQTATLAKNVESEGLEERQ